MLKLVQTNPNNIRSNPNAIVALYSLYNNSI